MWFIDVFAPLIAKIAEIQSLDTDNDARIVREVQAKEFLSSLFLQFARSFEQTLSIAEKNEAIREYGNRSNKTLDFLVNYHAEFGTSNLKYELHSHYAFADIDGTYEITERFSNKDETTSRDKLLNTKNVVAAAVVPEARMHNFARDNIILTIPYMGKKIPLDFCLGIIDKAFTLLSPRENIPFNEFTETIFFLANLYSKIDNEKAVWNTDIFVNEKRPVAQIKHLPENIKNLIKPVYDWMGTERKVKILNHEKLLLQKLHFRTAIDYQKCIGLIEKTLSFPEKPAHENAVETAITEVKDINLPEIPPQVCHPFFSEIPVFTAQDIQDASAERPATPSLRFSILTVNLSGIGEEQNLPRDAIDIMKRVLKEIQIASSTQKTDVMILQNVSTPMAAAIQYEMRPIPFFHQENEEIGIFSVMWNSSHCTVDGKDMFILHRNDWKIKNNMHDTENEIFSVSLKYEPIIKPSKHKKKISLKPHPMSNYEIRLFSKSGQMTKEEASKLSLFNKSTAPINILVVSDTISAKASPVVLCTNTTMPDSNTADNNPVEITELEVQALHQDGIAMSKRLSPQELAAEVASLETMSISDETHRKLEFLVTNHLPSLQTIMTKKVQKEIEQATEALRKLVQSKSLVKPVFANNKTANPPAEADMPETNASDQEEGRFSYKTPPRGDSKREDINNLNDTPTQQYRTNGNSPNTISLVSDNNSDIYDPLAYESDLELMEQDYFDSTSDSGSEQDDPKTPHIKENNQHIEENNQDIKEDNQDIEENNQHIKKDSQEINTSKTIMRGLKEAKPLRPFQQSLIDIIDSKKSEDNWLKSIFFLGYDPKVKILQELKKIIQSTTDVADLLDKIEELEKSRKNDNRTNKNIIDFPRSILFNPEKSTNTRVLLELIKEMIKDEYAREEGIQDESKSAVNLA